MSALETPTRRPIRVLPRELAEKIAAGEVVERPASVVKELIENSIDAGASQIRIELEDGGRKRLSILDDGHGIPADELPLALERHATSKIDALDDLWNLHTMGFRGEALPSIAAVSRFTLESKFRGETSGRRLYLEGGRLLRDESADPTSPVGAASSGTLILVEDLFFNVPARLKFLKSKSGESALIRELIEREALCTPSIGFTLVSEGRKALSLKGGASAERVAEVFDTKLDHIESFESQFEDISVRGWLDRDERMPNGRHVYLSVNGRMVRDKLLQQAVLVGLRPRMMEGEYPKIYVAVDIAPADVDVNVHPAKSEVRFRKSRDVFQVVHGALDKLARQATKAFYATPLPEAEASIEQRATSLPPQAPTHVSSEQASIGLASFPLPQAKLFENERASYKTKDLPFSETAVMHQGSLISTPERETETLHSGAFNPQAFTGRSLSTPQSPNQTRAPGFSKLHYIGQLKNTYLLFQDENGLVVVDQHAAHERINYEKIKADFLANGLTAQPLLVSAIVKCSVDDVGLALENAEAFSKLGFEFEAFGDNCLLIRAAPEGMAADRARELFQALTEELREGDATGVLAADPSRLSAKVERVLATSACHASVRAGQSLSPLEARELASQMDETESSLNCPHGRPASIRLTFGQIEGLFKR